jgi:transposase-like protein
MTGDVEEAILQMYLCGISTRKIAGITDALSQVKIGKDALSRISERLHEQQRELGGSDPSKKLTPTSTWTPPT